MQEKRTILIIDDDEANLALLGAMLEIGGYATLKAGDGAKGLSILETYAVDSILLDVMMPGMDGFQVCRIIKTNPALNHIPVILVTALFDAASRQKASAIGADAFLSKPVGYDTLTRQVEACILQASPAA
ncbi:MAG: response regulator [Chloroflexi bacterium]|nr:response regulator [Chloroflexota bacterium]